MGVPSCLNPEAQQAAGGLEAILNTNLRGEYNEMSEKAFEDL